MAHALHYSLFAIVFLGASITLPRIRKLGQTEKLGQWFSPRPRRLHFFKGQQLCSAFLGDFSRFPGPFVVLRERKLRGAKRTKTREKKKKGAISACATVQSGRSPDSRLHLPHKIAAKPSTICVFWAGFSSTSFRGCRRQWTVVNHKNRRRAGKQSIRLADGGVA